MSKVRQLPRACCYVIIGGASIDLKNMAGSEEWNDAMGLLDMGCGTSATSTIV